MGACRQTMSIWFWIKKCFVGYYPGWPGGRDRAIRDLRRMLFKAWWRPCYRGQRQYVWHDSFGRYLNSWIMCPLFGHRNVQWLGNGSCSDDRPKWHCFACEHEVDPHINRIKKWRGAE